jgi:tRNA nucleotidyltransferase (CCA-adding enzyme)
MADYNYLLQNRLSPAQNKALHLVRDIVRAKGMTVFLAGGAVRDLTSGSAVRDLDVAVQGNALKLHKDLEKAGAVLTGEHEPSQTLFAKFPGGVRMEITSTRTETYPKPGKPVYKPAGIKEDLYRRDFTANAMALSLNEGSYGLLIDPMNGVADIESRQLRLVSNYGFYEDPSRLLRASRFFARMGWTLEEKTKARFDTAVEEKYIDSIAAFNRGYELEEIIHEDDPLRVVREFESAGWMKHIFAAWTPAKANAKGLEELYNVMAQLQMQGVYPDISAANFHLVTAKLAPKDISTLKKAFPREGFAKEIDALEKETKEFSKRLLGKEAATPSLTWKLFTSANPDAVLWLGYTGKVTAIQNKYKNFFNVWPLVRQRVPYTMMTEMRITPDLPRYAELMEAMFFDLMDGKLETPEAMKAFLEPYSPPAPPPPVHLRRPRAVKKADPKPRARKAKAVPVVADAVEAPVEVAAVAVKPEPAKTEAKKTVPAKAAAKKSEAPVKTVAKKAAVKPAPKKAVKPAPKPVAKKVAKPVKKAKPAPKPKAKPVAKPKAAKKAAPVKAKKAAKRR